MKIIFLTAGSRGDTQPFVALGKALKSKGQSVYIAATEDSKELVQRNGIEYIQIRGNIAELINGGTAKEAVKAANIFSFVKSLSNKQFKKALLNVTEDLYNASKGMDLIIYHPGISIGDFAGKDFNIPAITGSPFPLADTSEFPALLFFNPRPPKFFYKLTHKIMLQGLFLASKNVIKKTYKVRIKKNIPKLANPLLSSQIKLISCSDKLFPVSYPYISKGWWFLEEDSFKPSDELVQFIEEGSKPLYIGFGSIGDVNRADEITRIFIKAVKNNNSRAIIATGHGAFNQDITTDSDFFFVKEVPHSWLFPKMSIVIHHGGAGTSAAGFRAGVPSIIIPHGNDQFAWAWRAYELGIGVKPINIKELSEKSVTSAIKEARNNTIFERAREIGKSICNENGANDMAQYIIDNLLSRKE